MLFKLLIPLYVQLTYTIVLTGLWNISLLLFLQFYPKKLDEEFQRDQEQPDFPQIGSLAVPKARRKYEGRGWIINLYPSPEGLRVESVYHNISKNTDEPPKSPPMQKVHTMGSKVWTTFPNISGNNASHNCKQTFHHNNCIYLCLQIMFFFFSSQRPRSRYIGQKKKRTKFSLTRPSMQMISFRMKKIQVHLLQLPPTRYKMSCTYYGIKSLSNISKHFL